MFHHNKQSGFGLTESMIAAALFGGLIVAAIGITDYSAHSLKKIEEQGNLSIMKQAILNRISCEETVNKPANPCDQGMVLYDVKGIALNYRENSNNMNFKAVCEETVDKDYKITVQWKYSDESVSRWRNLFGEIPIECPGKGGPGVTSMAVNPAGVFLDGRLRICLNVGTGQLFVEQLYHDYFTQESTWAINNADGTINNVTFHGRGTLNLPGDWSNVCDATASYTHYTHNNSGFRNPPYISINNNPTLFSGACIYVDDALGNRGGQIRLRGFTFTTTGC